MKCLKFFSLFLSLLVLVELTASQNSICNGDVCHCDGYGRVRCHCKNDHEIVSIRQDGDSKILTTATEIEIANCSQVTFLSDALTNLRELRKINIYNVERLSLSENSLYWRFLPQETEMSVPGLQIGIHNTTIYELPSHSIKGRLDDIFFNHTKIDNIRPFAFSNFIGLRRIEIKDCTIRDIDPQAFKKFNLELISIEGTTFRTIPSRMFSDINVRRSFRMKNVTVGKIQSSSFILNDVPSIVIEDSRIGILEGDAFRTVTTGPVTLKDNTIHTMNLGAFAGFSLSTMPTVYGPMDFTLENITLTSLVTGSLQLDLKSYNLIIKNLRVNQLCGCSTKSKDGLSYYEMNLFCAIESPFSSSGVVYKSFSLYQEENCNIKELSTAAILTISAGVVVLILIIILIIICILRSPNKGFAWITGKKGKSSSNNTSDKEFPVILPDGRTYRETEVRVVFEKAQLLTTDL